ncbi:ceramidase domain-containing protein [Acuticoccus sp. I52.16.1]|uniref:ceramidase domain-containing protein n=1 Tax=Acuticoccus sp. I52.16.1 TaxID=2928472 RepID=UPI001FD1D627|nr:ceramidase domain-containing protein [Acuticoccus sp. I52.16.1]UOM33268.1 hypothetical protein MRB58_15530 [Acuticoccus sp. I52.16.1]
MDWHRPIDNYCERLGPEFWAEPLNAWSNAAFLVAAAVAAIVARRRGGPDVGVALLIAVMVAIGVGSFLFHTVATPLAALADVVPIQLFIVGYMALAMRRFAGMAWWGAAAVTAGFVAVSAVGGQLLGRAVDLNGSQGYIPPLLALGVVGAALWASGRGAAGRALILGAAIFALSLTFRTVDAAMCERLPTGTHILWHLLNGLLLGHLTVALIRHGEGPPRRNVRPVSAPPERSPGNPRP